MPYVLNSSSFDELLAIDFKEALLSRLAYQERKELELKIPDSLDLETGTKVKIDYRDDGTAYVSVILQELSDYQQTPKICDIPLTIELLSPRKLPIQVTQDLNSFWKTVYPSLNG